MLVVVLRFLTNVCPSDNSLKVQYYLTFGRHYHIYFEFIPTFTLQYESFLVSLKYSHYVYFFSRRLKLMS